MCGGEYNGLDNTTNNSESEKNTRADEAYKEQKASGGNTGAGGAVVVITPSVAPSDAAAYFVAGVDVSSIDDLTQDEIDQLTMYCASASRSPDWEFACDTAELGTDIRDARWRAYCAANPELCEAEFQSSLMSIVITVEIVATAVLLLDLIPADEAIPGAMVIDTRSRLLVLADRIARLRDSIKATAGMPTRQGTVARTGNPQPDPAAEQLQARLGGQSRSHFAEDPIEREFDVISDRFVAQTKPDGFTLNKDWRVQAKATIEWARKTGRASYFHFDGPPDPDVIRKLREYAQRYNVPIYVDTRPF